jgi:hypothetical protein
MPDQRTASVGPIADIVSDQHTTAIGQNETSNREIE